MWYNSKEMMKKHNIYNSYKRKMYNNKQINY